MVTAARDLGDNDWSARAGMLVLLSGALFLTMVLNSAETGGGALDSARVLTISFASHQRQEDTGRKPQPPSVPPPATVEVASSPSAGSDEEEGGRPHVAAPNDSPPAQVTKDEGTAREGASSSSGDADSDDSKRADAPDSDVDQGPSSPKPPQDPDAPPATLAPREGGWQPHREMTDADFDQSDLDTTFPPEEERVLPGIPLHADREHVYPPPADGGTDTEHPPVDMVLLFPWSAALWEPDYYVRDVMPSATNGGRLHVAEINPKWDPNDPTPPKYNLTRAAIWGEGTDRPEEVPPIIWVAHLSDSFNHNCPLVVRRKLEYYRPVAVIVISDEHGRTACLHRVLAKAANDLGIKLIVRQYSRKVSSGVPDSVKQVPLGYMTGIWPLPPAFQRPVLRRASSRALAWSFAGNKKGDRAAMLDSMRRADVGPNAGGLGSSSLEKMTRMYADSIFVLSPRGFSRMDCFRLYEASRLGAIPIVVPGQMGQRSFDDYIGAPGELPPWIFAGTWNDAAGQMRQLMADPNALDQRQNDVLRWWDRVNYNFRKAVYDAVSFDRNNGGA